MLRTSVSQTALGDRTTRHLLVWQTKVVAVLKDQVSRGHVLKFAETRAAAEFPDLVIASLGANRKDKPNGVATARVLHDGTNGLAVNTCIRIRDQEATWR